MAEVGIKVVKIRSTCLPFWIRTSKFVERLWQIFLTLRKRIFSVLMTFLLQLKNRIILLAVMVMAGSGALYAQINAEQMMRVGQNALYFEDYMLSIQYFNQAIKAKPYMAQPYFMRAIAKLNLEDYLGAEEDATEAIERNPFIVDAYEVRGVARHNRGKYKGAVEDYNSALTLYPKSRGLMLNKAMAQQDLRQPDSAAVTFDALLHDFPNYENGYIGRARLRLAQGDTVKAREDIDHALGLNKNLINGYLLRADIAIHGPKDYEAALKDISEAIRLQPREPNFYINRAFLRHSLDDYSGAMVDYDYAIQLDPLNSMAIFNRGLLRMEVRDNDNAIKDFTKALELDKDDYRSLYNRAYLYSEKRDTKNALADINQLIEAFPDFPEALYMRSNLHRMNGDMKQAEKDYKSALAMAKNLKPSLPGDDKRGWVEVNSDGQQKTKKDGDAKEEEAKETELTPEAVAKRFTALRTIENPIEFEGEYNNKNIRGKVQDRHQRIELEPMFALSYYTSPTELRPSAYYIKEVDDVNSTRMLRFLVQLTNDDIALDDEEYIRRHFQSIEYYNSYLATHTPRAIDYFGRAMDFSVLRDYASAVSDLTKALELTPDFALGYFQRAVARCKALQAGTSELDGPARQAEIRAIVSDFDKAIELSPRMAFAAYNKGNMLALLGDYTSALQAYNKAIELKSDFGEAYYNRGYVYFQLGNQDKGVENLSKAGELGVMPSYNLLKRMN